MIPNAIESNDDDTEPTKPNPINYNTNGRNQVIASNSKTLINKPITDFFKNSGKNDHDEDEVSDLESVT